MGATGDDEVSSRGQSEPDGHDQKHFDNRPGCSVDVDHPHRFAQVVATRRAELAALARLARERLRDADRIERFADHLVHRRHLLEHFLHRTTHHLADVDEDVTGKRDKEHEHESQLPANTARRHKTRDRLQRLANHLSEEHFEADADLFGVVRESRHEVRRAGARDLADVLVNGPAEEARFARSKSVRKVTLPTRIR